MKVNKQIKNRREQIGLTQVQIAEKTGITVRAYQYIEADERIPNIRTAIRIADVLGVKDLRLLWGGNPTK